LQIFIYINLKYMWVWDSAIGVVILLWGLDDHSFEPWQWHFSFLQNI